jgi:hypothetical protein
MEWLTQENLEKFCSALLSNGGVIPKDNDAGRQLAAIMKQMRDEIDTVPKDSCLALINNQLAPHNTTLAELISQDFQ